MVLRFLLLLLLTLPLFGQTHVTPVQVKNWEQVQPLISAKAPVNGTTLPLQQVNIANNWIAGWNKVVALQVYDHYRIAVVGGQPYPVLITCMYPLTYSYGEGCAGGWPLWFMKQNP